jgi:molybdopterin/thiamine biosynthesis adenylyltransferase
MIERPLHISLSGSAGSDRFDRFRLIAWWDQSKLSAAKVLVIGAGALGNEIVKNLALLGIGNILVADMDRVENSNLSRSVLYRESDNGRFKADVAVEAASAIYPEIRAHAFNGNVVYDLGMGVFRWADVVIAGLDNREARLSINRSCQKVNRPWIDGAIESIAGTARVFHPGDGPCYECTMSQTDWKLLQARRSCNLLSRSDMEQGKTPTTPTIASIIAAIQCQEAVKLLHGMPTISGRGWVFEGLSADSYLVEYQRKDDCLSHETLSHIHALDAGVDDLPIGELLSEAHRLLPGSQLELSRDVLRSLDCPRCGQSETMFVSLGKVRAEKAPCPNCPGVRREVKTFFQIGNDSFTNDRGFLDKTLGQIGIPPLDIVIARSGGEAIGFELAADRQRVLGPLAAETEALSWE